MPQNLDELVALLRALPDMAPLERARACRRLDNAARAVLGRVGDEAVYEATRAITHREVAAELEVSPSRIGHAVHRYHQARGIRLGRGHPKY